MLPLINGSTFDAQLSIDIRKKNFPSPVIFNELNFDSNSGSGKTGFGVLSRVFRGADGKTQLSTPNPVYQCFESDFEKVRLTNIYTFHLLPLPYLLATWQPVVAIKLPLLADHEIKGKNVSGRLDRLQGIQLLKHWLRIRAGHQKAGYH